MDLMAGIGKKKAKKEIRKATEEEQERATLAVTTALEKKSLMSYGRFWSYVTQRPVKDYRPSETAFAIRVADQVQAGASALLVNKGGRYGGKAPAEQHHKFLEENGFENLPEQK
jgi:hypothetical protein